MGRILLYLCFGLLYCCGSALDPGERDYRVSLRQVEGRASPSKRSIQRLLQAFDVVQGPDYVRARTLEQDGDAANWPERHALYSQMYERLLAVSSYFPVGAANDYRGGYGLTVLDSLRETARVAAGAYYLTLVDAAIPAARVGSKPAARETYGYLQQALEYLPERRPMYTDLLAEMADRGTVRILLTVVGDPWLTAIARQSPYLRGAVVDDWFIIDFDEFGQAVDYEALLQLNQYRTDGPYERSSDTRYTKEVLDYVEKEEYEERINDSTVVTKVREIEHFKTITATVTEVKQEYELDVYGELSVFNSRTGLRAEVLPVSGSEDWENEYATCSGDREALPPFACSGSHSWPPGTESMLRKALDDLLRAARWKLTRTYAP